MKSESERAKLAATLQTVLVCAVVEGLLLLALRLATVNLLEAVVLSIVVFGLLSLWLAGPLYRYLLLETQ